MTIQEASIRFQIEPETLQFYLENELLTGTRTEDGIPDYKEENLQRAVQLDTTSQQVKLLRKFRYQLLEEIHGKQQCLDQLDYFIHEIQQKQTKKEVSSL